MFNKKVHYDIDHRSMLREKSINFKKYKLAIENNLTYKFENLKEDYGLINMFMQLLTEVEKEIFIYRFLEIFIWDKISERTGMQAISCQKIERKIIDKWGVFIQYE